MGFPPFPRQGYRHKLALCKGLSGYMPMNQDITVSSISLVCPECNCIFRGSGPIFNNGAMLKLLVECDLHHVFSDPAIRAALVAICSQCKYAWWTSDFERHHLNPEILQPSPDIEHTKKYALAMACGRRKNVHPFELAFMSLNGTWCAREAKESTELWMALSKLELEKALADERAYSDPMSDNSVLRSERGYYRYQLAEICRQAGDFLGAVRNFDLVETSPTVPTELVALQRKEAMINNQSPCLLPDDLANQLIYGRSTLPVSA